MKATAEVWIDRSIEDVWRFAGDVANMEQWVEAISEFKSGDGEYCPGYRFGSKFTYAAGSHDITCVLTDFTPPHTIAFKSLTGPFPFDGTIRLEPADGGTSVSNTMNAGADSLATRIMFTLGGPLFRRLMRRQLQKELNIMRRIVEERSQPPPTA